MSKLNAVYSGTNTAVFSVHSHKEYTLVITGHLFKTSSIKDWLEQVNAENHPLLSNLIVTLVINASQLTVNIKGELLDAEKFVWYVAGHCNFMPVFDYGHVKHTVLTPHGAATLYKAIARCCETCNVLPEDVMQDPNMSGDLIKFIKDSGYDETQAKAMLATAGYDFVQ